MQKIIAAFGLVAVVAVGLFFWQRDASEKNQMLTKENEQKLSVVTTFYPLENFAEAVGGDAVTVESIVPAGVEPHEYEPTTKDILKAYQADVFLLNGAGVDAWAEKIRPELEARGVKVVQMSELVPLLPASHEEEEEHEGEGGEHQESQFDPHFWLDPIFAEKEVLAIKEALIARDAAAQAVYAEGSTRYARELQALDALYRTELASCQLHSIVTSHNAFSYMGQRYGFETISLSGISPEAEPSSRHLAEIASLTRERGIKHIFFETLVSPKLAQTLANEVGAEPLVFNPLEGLTDEERATGADYLSIMKQNLENLKTALQCQK